MSRTAEIQAKHAKFVLTPWVAQGGLVAPVIDRAEGRFMYDTDGKSYFDLASGLIAVNLGHSHPKVVRAIADQAAALCYAPPSLFNEKRALLGEELSNISPWSEGARSFFTTAGCEANDDCVRMVRALTGRHKIMVAYRSYHGASGTSLAMTGEDRRWLGEGAGGSSGGDGMVRFFAPFPYRSPFFTELAAEETERALDHVRRTLMHEDPRRVAAIFIEPVVGSNGVITYPVGYLEGLRKVADEAGILLVFDEVMTGFGRTGATFACERFGVKPDILTFAKGVTSAYVPFGGILVREGLAKHFDAKQLPNGHTYSGHPMGVAAALATLSVYKEEGLYTRGLEIEKWIHELVLPLKAKYEIVGDVRGAGAFYALEFVKDKASRTPLVPWQGDGMGIMKNFYMELRKRGVYSFGRYNIAMCAPPLTTTREEFATAVVALDESIGALAALL
jgi:taurine---2-oxoglutarate transaminase